MRRYPAKAAPMRTVGVKIPEDLWDRLNDEVRHVKKINPGLRYTVSDLIRSRLLRKTNGK